MRPRRIGNGWRRRLGTLATFPVLLAFAGCDADSRTSDPTAANMAAPSPTANAWLADDVIARAIKFRNTFGLRSDLAWIRDVAEMPTAIEGFRLYGVPLAPDELAALTERTDAKEQVELLVDAYGLEHPEEWAGMSNDNRVGGVIARFTGHVGHHEAALKSQLAPEARLSVVQVRWTLAELETVKDRIRIEAIEDPAWLLEQGLKATGLAIDIESNQILLRVSSTRMDLDELLEAHFDASDKLWIQSDGTGIGLLPRGNIEGRVVDAAGAPVAGARIEVDSNLDGVDIGGSEMGYATDDTGRFLVRDILALTYVVHVYGEYEYLEDELVSDLLGSSDPVRVIGGETANVVITID
jgi:hypothetical protein